MSSSIFVVQVKPTVTTHPDGPAPQPFSARRRPKAARRKFRNLFLPGFAVVGGVVDRQTGSDLAAGRRAGVGRRRDAPGVPALDRRCTHRGALPCLAVARRSGRSAL